MACHAESFVFSDSVTIKQFNVKRGRGEDGCAMGRILVIQRVRTAGEFVWKNVREFEMFCALFVLIWQSKSGWASFFSFFLFFKRDISVNIIARAKQKKYQQIKFRVDRVKGGSNYVRDGQRNEREAYSEFVLRFLSFFFFFYGSTMNVQFTKWYFQTKFVVSKTKSIIKREKKKEGREFKMKRESWDGMVCTGIPESN
jgi:hypothetical protein